MLTVQLILWVANMALACSTTNRAWAWNAGAAFILTLDIAAQGL